MNGRFSVSLPANEPIGQYAPADSQTASLKRRLQEFSSTTPEIPCVVGGKEIFTGEIKEHCAPHDHGNVLWRHHCATPEVLEEALRSSREAWQDWSRTPVETRVAVFEKAAELLAGPWRDTINATTMLGQSKTCFQAEIDAACELIDFWRFNNYFAVENVYSEQPPHSPFGTRNRMDHRPLEGFVYAISPFNFTSIAGNLAGAPALMGNVALWKPSDSAVYSNYFLMKLYEAAGLPAGVINFIPGDHVLVTDTLLAAPDFGGLHFTGSTDVFRYLWREMAEKLDRYQNYPRIVGETGGKDFIFVHESADVRATAIAALRGAFEYQGQKCSAASRMYVPRKLWGAIRDQLIAEMKTITMGDPADFSNFMAAVIHERSFVKISEHIGYARENAGASILQGGEASRDNGWFIQPTLIECEDPRFRTMEEEIFGPVLSVHVYDENDLDGALELCDATSPYALTGAVFAQDRGVAAQICDRLRFAAGNFYINDKPTGAVVGQQPFGGARGSGTDDKAGSALNLLRWVAPRTIKETYVPPTEYGYPHMA